MSSLYLGKIGTKEEHYEIHAFTSALPFREFSSTSIADPNLFQQLIKGRYQLYEDGRNIFSTAVSPNSVDKIVLSPHDTREGTVHIVALDKDGKISCAVSVAVDTGEKEKGELIGLPLENRWKKNNFPVGKKMDDFRKLYFQKRWNINEAIKPWQMADLYRHFKSGDGKTGINARLGIYVGCYHLLVREARKGSFPPCSLWVFDAIPKFFNLYRLAGSAVLRKPILQERPEFISPSPDKLKEVKTRSGVNELQYEGEKIALYKEVPIARKQNGELCFETRQIPFLEGIVDMHKCEEAGRNNPFSLRINNVSGISHKERIKLIFGTHVIGKRVFDENKSFSKIILKTMNNYIRNKLNADLWEFNEIGS